jgi:hypothetical protein
MNDLLTNEPSPNPPTGVNWETLIVDPRFQDRLHRKARGKTTSFFWALASGCILMTVGIAVTAIL